VLEEREKRKMEDLVDRKIYQLERSHIEVVMSDAMSVISELDFFRHLSNELKKKVMESDKRVFNPGDFVFKDGVVSTGIHVVCICAYVYRERECVCVCVCLFVCVCPALLWCSVTCFDDILLYHSNVICICVCVCVCLVQIIRGIVKVVSTRDLQQEELKETKLSESLSVGSLAGAWSALTGNPNWAYARVRVCVSCFVCVFLIVV